MDFKAFERQGQIFSQGVAGVKPIIPADFNSLESKAHSRLSHEAKAYIAGGAGLESTMKANRSDFEGFAIIPQVLNDISQRVLSKKIAGINFPVPFFLCPIGVLELAHPGADLAVAKACKELEIPMIVSNQASYSMESISKILNPNPWFFQLYISKSDAVVKSFVSRAENAGAAGLVITLDTKMLGWRSRDLNLGFLPFLKGMGIAQYTSDPEFLKLADTLPDDHSKKKITLKSVGALIEMSRRHPGKFLENIRGKALKSVKTFTQIYSRQSIDWDTIKWIRSLTKLPIILKGIQDPYEADKAVDEGIDMIYVSNHGGRQVDGAISSLSSLSEISKIIAKRIPLLFDSGIRSGADILKAIALGADAVGIGRPYVYALNLAGSQGVSELILNMAADFELNMGLSGIHKVDDLSPKILKKI